MPFWTTFEIIHIHTLTRLFITKGMTIKIHRVNTGLETIHKVADRNEQRKYLIVQGWTMII